MICNPKRDRFRTCVDYPFLHGGLRKKVITCTLVVVRTLDIVKPRINRRSPMDAEAVKTWVAATLGIAVSRVVRACDDANPMSGEPESAISVDENVVTFNILSAELASMEQDAETREAAHSQAMLEAAKAAQEGQRDLEGRCVELMAELSEQRASAHVVTPKRMKLMEDLAEKRASSWKRSLELMTKLAEQRDDAVRQLEEEWH